ncbi:MAG TPA: cadherin repeat domain-containing protein, partial [Candidatus Limnocylindria bacterium]|nr:cadherin repeat domain-containing protein [Candidatus Limnocylindria bacterium]
MKKLRSALYLGLIPVVFYVLAGCSGGGSGAIVVNISSGAFAGTAIDQGQTLTLTGQVKNDKGAAGVMWTLTQNGMACSPGCGQLMNSSTTQTTYNAPAAGNASIQVTITATSVADGTKHQDFVLTITLKPSIAAQNLAQGTAGVAYGPQQVVETGGAGTLTWAIMGALPAALNGLTIDPSTGKVSGTPAGPAGTFNFTVQVTDSGNPAIQASGQITIKLVLPAPPTITSASPLNPAATVGVVYNFTFAANGAGPFTWAAMPALTNGLTFNANGTITGTPTAPPTTLNFNVTVTDKFGQPSAATPFKLVISFPPPPTITSTSPLNPAATVGVVYNFAFAANGAGPFTWAAAPPLT